MATITAIELIINGTEVKAPKVGGITYKAEKVWSSNTGRTASGKMVGTIKCIKRTFSIKWSALTNEEKERIERAVSNASVPFAKMSITQPDGSSETVECYFGTPTFEGYDMIGGQWRYTSGTVDAIER